MKDPPDTSTYDDFMVRAYAMELEASERYTNFSEQLEKGNNREVSLLFQALARAEGLHANRILTEMGWSSPPPLSPAFAWEGSEGPETASLDSLLDPIQPPRALVVALHCEQKAQKYFENIASSAAPARVCIAAAAMATEEREHSRLIESWLARMPRPLFGWK